MDLVIQKVDSDNESFQSYSSQWEDEMERIFPDYSEEDAMYGSVLLLELDKEVVGAFVYQIKGEELHIDLDYLNEEHRNKGIGQRFFNSKLEEFKTLGIELIVAVTVDSIHRAYLMSLGFKLSDLHADRYEMEL